MNYDITISEFNDDMFSLHNEYREKHHSDPLQMTDFVSILIYFIHSADK